MHFGADAEATKEIWFLCFGNYCTKVRRHAKSKYFRKGDVYIIPFSPQPIGLLIDPPDNHCHYLHHHTIFMNLNEHRKG